MKKLLALSLALALISSSLGSCKKAPTVAPVSKTGVELRIVTPYGSDDGNQPAYLKLLKQFESETGVTVVDDSSVSNEEWKAKVNGDFQTDNEPDVLLYFTGYDANEIVRSGKVVPVREIQQHYPEYAANMRFELMPVSIVDGRFYAVPVNGYWEALFVNKSVLKQCGIDNPPDKNTTWAEFLQMCEQIKEAGFTPIAVSLQEVPHYLLEYMLFNEGGPNVHTQPPMSVNEPSATRWIKALDMIKSLYEKEYFPVNTLTISDSDAFWQLCSGTAAFSIDGSWRVGWLAGGFDDKGNETSPAKVENIDDFTITYVPGNGTRKSTDIISGISMGYFITKRAWDDPEKREAAVKLVQTLTSDSAINTLSQGAPTALIERSKSSFNDTSIHQAAQELLLGATSTTPAAQDFLSKSTRLYIFNSVKDIVTGKITSRKALNKALLAPY